MEGEEENLRPVPPHLSPLQGWLGLPDSQTRYPQGTPAHCFWVVLKRQEGRAEVNLVTKCLLQLRSRSVTSCSPSLLQSAFSRASGQLLLLFLLLLLSLDHTYLLST